MAGNDVVQVTSATWKTEVLGAAGTVLVDFWAPWCGPCKMLAPVLDQVAAELAGKLKVCKVNVDDSPDLASQFGVRSIPTLLVFKQGVVKEQMVGAIAKPALLQKLSAHV